ncbi:MAG TPA: aminopeptidase [Clostridiales bacterium]|nr:aminopeptidase [Clostridiales bacterium]
MTNTEEKSQAVLLKEKLLFKKECGIKKLSDEEIEKADQFCADYVQFLNSSKTEREAVATALEMAKAAGFAEFDPQKKYSAGDKIYCINRKKNIVLAVIGTQGAKDGVRFAIAHVDSPRLDLKPYPLYEANDLALFKTHYYGGIKKYQWTAIPLALHGVVALKDNTTVQINIGEGEADPCFCVTDLLPHLAQEQMAKTGLKVFTGEDLNVLVGSRPFKDDKEAELVKLNIMNIMFEKYGITEEDFLSAELELVPAFKAKDLGFDRSMIAGYGHDDRVCAYPALMAAINAKAPTHTVVTILVDKEEIGSEGNTGMQSDFMRFFINDLAKTQGLEGYQVLSRSKCLSADVNAAFDPTYASVYESNNSCFINNGVCITKYTGHGGKYDTSDASAEFMAEIRQVLEKDNVLWQSGELGKVDGGGGGTIAKYVANMNVDVVDLGVPVLSMHAPLEVVSKVDVYMAYKAFSAFFNFD